MDAQPWEPPRDWEDPFGGSDKHPLWPDALRVAGITDAATMAAATEWSQAESGARSAMSRSRERMLAQLARYGVTARDVRYWRDGYGHEARHRPNTTAQVRF